MKLSHFAVKHPAVIGMLLIVLIVFGIYFLTGLNVEFMSDISLPSVEILTIYPGAAAEDVEQDVTRIIEDEMVTLPGFKSVSSTSGNSFSWVTVTFQDGMDPYEQLPEMRNRVGQLKASLPDGLQGEPYVIVAGANMLPVMTFSVEGGDDLGRLTSYVQDNLIPRITRIPGVAQAVVQGGSDLQVEIKLRISDLESKGVSVLQVYQILNASNTQLPLGNADWNGSNLSVRYDGSLKSLSDIADLPVGFTDNQTIIRLSDVADIALKYPQPTSYVDSEGHQTVVVSVSKRTDGNAMTIAKEVKKVLEEAAGLVGGDGIHFQILSDDSRTVSASLTTVINSGLMGIIMAIVVIFLFLADWRATLIIGISIPMSILFTFIGMRVMGITINLMSLSGMVVALGMVVDASIVMLEQVYRYYRKPGFTIEGAIFRGSDEVSSSIVASALTTIVVFIPLAMLPGIVGSILRDVSLTLVLAMTASMIVAILVVPFLMKIVLKEGKRAKEKVSAFNRGIAKLERGYRRGLVWSLNNRKFILLAALIVLVFSVLLITMIGISFIPSTDNSDFQVNLEFPIGYTIDQTRSKAAQAEDIIRSLVPEIQSLVFYSGQAELGIGGSTPNTAYANIVLAPKKERDRDIHEIILQVQQALSASISDAQVKVINGGYDKLVGYVSGGGGYALELTGEDMDVLYQTASSIRDFLAADPSVVLAELDTSYDTGTVIIDMAHEYMNSIGVTSYEAGMTTGILFRGVDAGRYTADGERYTIRLTSDVADKPLTVDTLSDISVFSLTGTPISFANIADLKMERSISQVNRSERARTITVSTVLVSEDASGVTSRMNAYLEENPLPAGVKSKTGGIMELIGDSFSSLFVSLAIAIFLVYTVMVLQFERFRQPLIVMGSIPFCIIGVVMGLLLFGSTMSLIALMGIVALGGVVVNNGIILVDYINLLRTQKKEDGTDGKTKDERIAALRDCITDGASSRIRPILMTTLTTMFGVVPMAFSRGEGAEIYAPLGQAIAGGLFTSTLITLFVIPVLYYILEKRKIKKISQKEKEIADEKA